MLQVREKTPPNFVSVSWREVLPDEEIFVAGTHQGSPVAYGPFVVLSKHRRMLRNAQRRTFMHYPEDLLRRLA